MERLVSPNKVMGVKQVKNAVLRETASVVYIAQDVDKGILDEIIELCKEKKIETVLVSTRKELAKHCKIDVPCAVAALIND